MAKMSAHGLLIAFEGIDGSGKTTLTHALYEALVRQNIAALLTKEPGSTPFGKQIRALILNSEHNKAPLAEYLLFAADRADHIVQIVKPALAAGKVVLCDRMADSAIAYQGYGRGLNIHNITTVNEWTLQGIRPDITFYLEIDYATAQNRIGKRMEAQSSFDQAEEAFFARVVHGYEVLYQDRTDVIRINASHAPEIVFDEVLHQILSMVGSVEA